MSEAVQIDISVAQPQQAAGVLEAMAAATEKLAKREAEYQAMLAKRMAMLDGMNNGSGGAGYGGSRGGQPSGQAGGGLPSPSGGKKAQLDDEQKYQQYLQKQIELLERRKRLEEDLIYMGHKPDANERYKNKFDEELRRRKEREQIKEDMIKGGHVPAPLTGEDAYQDKLAKEKARIEERFRMNRDLEESGHRRSKSEEMEAKRIADEKKQMQSGGGGADMGGAGAWLAMLGGRPVEAVVTGFLGVGKASAAVMASMYALRSATESAAEISHLRQSKYMPEETRQRKIDEAAFILGPIQKWFNEIGDKWSGRSAQYHAMMSVVGPQREIEHAANLERFQTDTSLYERQHLARRQAGMDTPGDRRPMYGAPAQTAFARSSGSALVDRAGGRGTVAGEREYEFVQRRMDPMIAHHAAQGERENAESSLRFSEFRERQAIAQLERHRGLLREAQQMTGSGAMISGGGGTLTDRWDPKGLNSFEVAQKEAMSKQAQLNIDRWTLEVQNQSLTVFEKRQKLAQATAAEGRAYLEIQKAELSLLREKEQRVVQRAQSTGRMTHVDFQLAVNAAEIIKQHGLEAVNPEMREQARSLIPDHLQKLEEAQSEKMFQQYGARERLGDTLGDMETPAEIRRAVAQAQADIKVEVAFNEQKLADQIVASFNDKLGDTLITNIIEKVNVLIDIRVKNAVGGVETRERLRAASLN